MKLFELISSLSLSIDNPGGRWLEGKRKYALENGKNSYGAPNTLGSVTGYFNRFVLLPIDLLLKVKGIRGEQGSVREDSLEWLKSEMKRTGELPRPKDKQYAPFIVVDQTGTPWVNEGNHRIMAASSLGWKYLPVEVRYFNGGEDEPGIFNPSDLKKYDLQASSKGYSPGDDFKGELEK